MKTSDKILMLFLAVLAVCGIGLVITIRMAITTPAADALQKSDFASDTILYEGEIFTDVSVSGVWAVTLIEADSHSVVFERDENADYRVSIGTRGETLHLVSTGMSFSEDHPRVLISTPLLSSLSIKGAGEATLKDFRQDALRIHATGPTQIILQSCKIGSLALKLRGVFSMDAKASSFRNVDMDVAGAFEMLFTMEKGRVGGKARGLGGIELHGDMLANELQSSGLIEVTTP